MGGPGGKFEVSSAGALPVLGRGTMVSMLLIQSLLAIADLALCEAPDDGRCGRGRERSSAEVAGYV